MRMGIEREIIEIIKTLYRNNINEEERNNNESSKLSTEINLRQGCVLGPLLSTVLIDDVIKVLKGKCTNIIVKN